MNAAASFVSGSEANSTFPSADVPSSHSEVFEQLYPAILAVFVTIVSGYFCGRNGIVTEVEGHGLNIFVSRFALPAMLFRAMATLDFRQVDWNLLSGLLVGKSVVFFTVLIMTIVLSGKPMQLGRAGLFAILASQSNDFALGFPIVEALYKSSHPELLQYIYLAAPISLVILNPIGFCLLEYEKNRAIFASSPQATSRSGRFLSTSWNVVRGIFSNAINCMTFIGVLANVIFDRRIPLIVDNLLTVLGSAFPAAALFYLGLKMVGRLKAFYGFRMVVPVLLVVAKLIFLPLLNRVMIGHLTRNETLSTDYANFGFLFGTFPTAPTVFVFASLYNKEIDTVGTTLVLSTFLSGPWMFVSAQMLSIPSINVDKFASMLAATQFDVGVLGLACAIWVIGILITSRRWKRLLHSLTFGLMLAHVLTCCGMLSWHTVNPASWSHYVQFFVFYMGLSATRLWTAALAMGFCLLNARSLCYMLRFRLALYLACFGVSIVLTSILMIFGTHSPHDINPAFHYGSTQVKMSAALLTICFAISVVGMVIGQVVRRRNLNSPKTTPRHLPILRRKLPSVNQSEFEDFDEVVLDRDMEDLIEIQPCSDAHDDELINGIRPTCALAYACTTDRRRKCRQRIRTYETMTVLPEDLLEGDGGTATPAKDYFQQDRHLILLLSLTTSMFIGMFLCYWRIFAPDSSTSGIFVEVEFLDGMLLFGQSCFAFAVFGMETNLGVLVWIKRIYGRFWRKPTS